MKTNHAVADQLQLEELIAMQVELESERLEVALCPAAEQKHSDHMVRVAIGKNPYWYSRLCALRGGNKGGHAAKGTKIRRAAVERVLASLIEGKAVRSFIGGYLLGVANERVAQSENCPF